VQVGFLSGPLFSVDYVVSYKRSLTMGCQVTGNHSYVLWNSVIFFLFNGFVFIFLIVFLIYLCRFVHLRGRKDYEPPRYMTINTAIEQLLEIAQAREVSSEFFEHLHYSRHDFKSRLCNS
jgi:heme/copper-type cytochrome/quinol oxidase subunit 2